MFVNKFEYLPHDILFEIFDYLSPVEILQSFLSLNKSFSRILIKEYLWHIHIDGNTTSFSMFNNLCHDLLRLIRCRIISLRITLTNVINGWSIISPSLNQPKTTLLRRLHLIDIGPYAFNQLLNNHLIKQIHTLLVDVGCYSSFNSNAIEGKYLAKVSEPKLSRVVRY